MPSPRIKVVLTGTAAQLQAAKPLVQGVVPPANRIQRKTYDWTTSTEGILTTTCFDFELKTLAWGNAAWADFVAVVPNVRATGVTGLMHYHQCSHLDAVVEDCRTAPASAYVEVTI